MINLNNPCEPFTYCDSVWHFLQDKTDIISNFYSKLFVLKRTVLALVTINKESVSNWVKSLNFWPLFATRQFF